MKKQSLLLSCVSEVCIVCDKLNMRYFFIETITLERNELYRTPFHRFQENKHAVSFSLSANIFRVSFELVRSQEALISF